ncbi:MAG: PIG-L family deacetylase [Elusimicrobiota bacterium]|jgi:LmbE family N-acetylglucosaminyl deacetylase|nr:PIG-L family deacetylase [Elusimicrobiota bacterium]
MNYLKNRTIFKLYEKVQPFLDYKITLRPELPGQNVLAVVVNVGDEVLGCGGTLLKHISEGGQVDILYCSVSNSEDVQEYEKVAHAIGAKNVHFTPYKKNNFDKVKFQQTLSNLLSKVNPDIVFVPSMLELDPANRAISKALVKIKQKESLDFLVFAYSSFLPILPNTLIDISKFAAKKKQILEYVNQIQRGAVRDYVKIAQGISQYWGQIEDTSINFAEAFLMLTADKYTTLAKKTL